jgi:glycosyltransferase involved in cell wall biosynthesis
VNLPTISIVTPSFNQGEYLEETICSVLDQSYPKLEYIVIDGGSTDNSIDIIRKYQSHLKYWCSEKDQGQANAINKGFQLSNGQLLGWLNSDDVYLPGALAYVAECFSTRDWDVFSANTAHSLDGHTAGDVRQITDRDPIKLLRALQTPYPQPSTFWTHATWRQCGPLDESLHYCMYFVLCWRFVLAQKTWGTSDQVIALFRRHSKQKTWTHQYADLEKHKALELLKCFARSVNPSITPALEDASEGQGWLRYWTSKMYTELNRTPTVMDWIRAPLTNPSLLHRKCYYRQLYHSARKLAGTLVPARR